MSAWDYKTLAAHAGHRIECVTYGNGANVAVECVDCHVVLIEFDNEEDDE